VKEARGPAIADGDDNLAQADAGQQMAGARAEPNGASIATAISDLTAPLCSSHVRRMAAGACAT
jgi:hypothetical protein